MTVAMRYRPLGSTVAGWVYGLLGGLLVVGSLHAQEVDSTRTPTDSLRAPSSPSATSVPGFRQEPFGEVVGDTLPARRTILEASEALAALPGTFFHDFGTPGWPDGWHPWGLDGARVALVLADVPMQDLATGVPRYDLVPFPFTAPLRLQPTRHGAALGVEATVRAFEATRPVTELRYQSLSLGMQFVTVAHAQERSCTLFGKPGRLHVLFGYGGHAARGEYPGSRLRRGRQVLARLRYQQPRWAVEVRNLHNRRRVGAHGGVVPFGNDYNSIYQRLGATVRNEDAERQTLRNDLSLTLQTRLLPQPLHATAFWTAETFGYTVPGDTLRTRMHRYGGFLLQPLGGVRLRVEGGLETVRSGNALPDTLDLRLYLHAAVRDTVRLGGLTAVLEGGFHAEDAAVFPSGLLHLRYRGLFAEVVQAGQTVSWVERHGFGRLLRPVSARPDGQVLHARMGFQLHLGAFAATLFGFAHQTSAPLDLFDIGRTDTIRATAVGTAFQRAGLALDLTWRQNAGHGLYAHLQPTFFAFLNPNASPLHERVAETLPSGFAQGRLGVRALLFKRDLNLNAYLQGRAWTSMRGRRLHPATGLLYVPAADARPVAASGTVDVVVEAGVRTATLFFGMVNLLSGTALVPGNLLVPDYPLPAQRLHFGVYWPILN